MNQPLNGVAEIPQTHVWNLWRWISLAIELVGPWNLRIRVLYIPYYKTAISDKILCWEEEQFPLRRNMIIQLARSSGIDIASLLCPVPRVRARVPCIRIPCPCVSMSLNPCVRVRVSASVSAVSLSLPLRRWHVALKDTDLPRPTASPAPPPPRRLLLRGSVQDGERRLDRMFLFSFLF